MEIEKYSFSFIDLMGIINNIYKKVKVASSFLIFENGGKAFYEPENRGCF